MFWFCLVFYGVHTHWLLKVISDSVLRNVFWLSGPYGMPRDRTTVITSQPNARQTPEHCSTAPAPHVLSFLTSTMSLIFFVPVPHHFIFVILLLQSISFFSSLYSGTEVCLTNLHLNHYITSCSYKYEAIFFW